MRRIFSTFLITALLGAVGGCDTQTGGKAARGTAKIIPQNIPDVPTGTELAVARQNFNSGNFGFSARYFEKAFAAAPKDMSACLGIAASYDWMYEFGAADRAYAKCGKIDKNSFHYNNNLGFSHILRGDYAKATALLARASQLRPGDPLVETNLRILRDATSG